MTLAIGRQIMIVFLFGVMRLLWIIDAATNVDRKTASKILRYIIVFGMLLALGRFAYSYKYTQDFFLGMYYQLEGYPASVFYDTKIKPVQYPLVVNNIDPPYISARSVLVMDKTNDKVLLDINAEESLAPASTTKLMTALIAVELYSPDEEIEMSAECADVQSTKAYLVPGAKYRVRDLLDAMLISSAGDAACALASGKISQKEFIGYMNSKAQQLGMPNTHFSNPIGLDGNGAHRSTATDLYKLSTSAMQYDLIREAVTQKTFEIRSADKKHLSSVFNTNKLLWEVEGTLGIKTGTTAEAGEVLIYENSDGKKDLVIIVMASQDRFGDTTKLLDWANQKFFWK